MVKVLLTGGLGFIGSHILQGLLSQGHSVYATVRSEEQASRIRTAHANHASQGKLRVLLVADIVKPNAFDPVISHIEAVEKEQGEGGLEVVIHTASPTNFRWTDARAELVEPAINGTTGILSAVHRFAPSVRRVVITSSTYSVVDQSRLLDPEYTFSERDWSPDTMADLNRDIMTDYGVAKVLAERAAWAFVEREKPAFDLVAVCPSTALGPLVHQIPSLDAVNASNNWVHPLLTGQWKSQIPSTGKLTLWVDVRDAAKAHILAALSLPPLEKPLVQRRLLLTGGRASKREIARIVRENFPEYADRVPGPEVQGGEIPDEDQVFKYNNEETVKLLGIEWTSLEKSIVDTVKSVRSHII